VSDATTRKALLASGRTRTGATAACHGSTRLSTALVGPALSLAVAGLTAAVAHLSRRNALLLLTTLVGVALRLAVPGLATAVAQLAHRSGLLVAPRVALGSTVPRLAAVVADLGRRCTLLGLVVAALRLAVTRLATAVAELTHRRGLLVATMALSRAVSGLACIHGGWWLSKLIRDMVVSDVTKVVSDTTRSGTYRSCSTPGPWGPEHRQHWGWNGSREQCGRSCLHIWWLSQITLSRFEADCELQGRTWFKWSAGTAR
jgi:hypothetical protein